MNIYFMNALIVFQVSERGRYQNYTAYDNEVMTLKLELKFKKGIDQDKLFQTVIKKINN